MPVILTRLCLALASTLLMLSAAVAQSSYAFTNLETCHRAAAASQHFTSADCDLAWQDAMANKRVIARVEICDAHSNPPCGGGGLLEDWSKVIAAGIAAGRLVKRPDPLLDQ